MTEREKSLREWSVDKRQKFSKKIFSKDEKDLTIDEMKQLDHLFPGWITEEVNTTHVDFSMGGTRARNSITKEEYTVYYPNDNYPFIILQGTSIIPASKQTFHRYIAMNMVKNDDPEHKIWVNHKDGNKWNNSYLNLEWCTPSENTLYSFEIGTSNPRRGEDSNLAKHTENQIIKVCEYLSNPKYVKWTYDMIGKECGVNAWCVGSIFRKERWPHISNKYNFLPRDTNNLHDNHGENNPSCIYSNERVEDVCCILDERAKGNDKQSFETISKITGVSPAMVYSIWRGRSRIDISSKHYFYQAMYQKV